MHLNDREGRKLIIQHLSAAIQGISDSWLHWLLAEVPTILDNVFQHYKQWSSHEVAQMYLEHQFLEDEEADAFLSTLPTGTNSSEEIREVTDHITSIVFGRWIIFAPHVQWYG